MTFSRRSFIKTTAIGTAGLICASPFADGFALTPLPASTDLYALSEQLLKQWAKGLLDLQVLDKANTNNYGGIYCPANKTVHGRVGDAIYPFYYLAEKTKDSRYIDAATLQYRWMERRVSQPDGSWLNEPVKDSWKGTTVFSSIALAETLKNHGSIMDNGLKKEIADRLLKAADYIYNNFSIKYGNINYPITASYALSLIGTMLDVPKYKIKGRELAHSALNYFTPKNGFLQGEGGPIDKPSPKGCFSIDLGYNVEESLPSLVLYGLLNNDEEVLTMVTRSLHTHMEFMLPDGGWDNSWGTRNYKWTYYGSRTTDGSQTAYALMAHRDARFYKAALKNTRFLQECTKDNLLQGGPHYASHNVPVCVHHTFCHIKSLTTILDHPHINPKVNIRTIKLPREEIYGGHFFRDIQTWLIAKGNFKATITGYDREYKEYKNGHASGGAMTMLWHQKTGPIFTASMTEYQMIEADNMQADTDPLAMPLTPRIELRTITDIFMNICDLDARIEREITHDSVIIKTRSKLVNKNQQDPKSGELNCRVNYHFTDKSVSIKFNFDKGFNDGKVKIILPVISSSTEKHSLNNNQIRIYKGSAILQITSTAKLTLMPTTIKNRVFNFVPGLEAIPLSIDQNEAIITIEVI
ncbi:twin-arginine translocation signal domain-containing protein [Mucilaginibacter aquaedulcis]|uniref:twin-arginine translocation signal domain-containing protein n=1 Tax=Mucilaginibacter aquaedulcis TaxID=1187081 RepID=UPI0025B31798|nr:twin-arginine translocation signal domain-containing protein [Mucilaginibacter aquaedulcis]MDN3547770.1 twin-arginine translocation signal domain-containing protein [Mucilaginibacter aquaedulcis]